MGAESPNWYVVRAALVHCEVMPLSRRRACLWLSLIVLASLVACLWSANARPDLSREWDERYTLRNVESILRTGSLKPIFPWYPSLSHLPQTILLAATRAVHDATGAEALAVFSDAQPPTPRPRYWLGALTPATFLVSRWTSVLFGVASILLTFHLGCRLFSREVGLLAAWFQAMSPWQIEAASHAKPDTLLVLLTLAAFLCALRVADDGGIRRYVLAGAAVGLASSAKQTGALAAIPLVTATVLHFRNPRRWSGLVVAGLASCTFFLLLNPYPDLLPRYLSMGKQYVGWAAHQASEELPTLLYFPVLVVSSVWHGPVIGVAALAGVGALVGVLYRRWRQQGATKLAMFLSFPVGFVLVCAAVSSYPKANVFLPTLPFTSIAAGWSVNKVWDASASRLSPERSRWLSWLGLIAILALLVPPWAAFTYAEAVPETTLDTVADTIAANVPFMDQRTVVYERDVGRLEATRIWTEGQGDSLVAHRASFFSRPEASLAEADERILDLADFEVFREERLHGPDRGFYLDRLLQANSRGSWIVEPRLLRTRGSRQVVVAHPWNPSGSALQVTWEPPARPRSRWRRGQLPPGLRRGEVISLNLELSAIQAGDCKLWLHKTELSFYQYHWRGQTVSAMTGRTVLERPGGRVAMRCGRVRTLRPPPEVAVWRWSP